MSQTEDLAAGKPKISGRKEVDWDAMENDWRAGIKPVLQLSKEYGVSRAAINKHWEKEGTERDLTARIEARAQALVTQAQVAQEVTPEQRVTEKAIVEANAQMQASVMLAHRKDIATLRAKAAEYKAELDAYPEELPKKVGVFKIIVDTQKTLIALEREAFNIGGVTPNDDDQVIVIRREIVGGA